ncbi:septation protein IspZ [Neisseria sp. N95_16]|uniref:Inner membrane-spanning protein YciB n=1 Tax=Neisseria brasiliensis TaxID=2666100 RepID=A0A7X2KWT9_9NEIS|nr:MULTISPECIES: septation protein IspZ [Neisseria]MRN36961.1 septation protein A [Neisseria brasiliensis]PJO08692.1 septation protein IspZ [Neisseria sp. N95_16]
MKALLDFLPLIVFFYLYKTVEPTDTNHPLLQLTGAAGSDNNHVLAATAGLIIATVLVYGYQLVKQKFRLERQQWFVLAMTVVFGGMTLALSDDYYIRLKAVLLNAAFGVGMLVSHFFFSDRRSAVQKMFDSVLVLSPDGWKKLNWAWAGMFFLLAALHAFFAFVFAGGRYWGEFTAFGDLIVMFSCMGIMFFVLRKHFKSE